VAAVGLILAAAAGALGTAAIMGDGRAKAGPVVGEPIRFPIAATPSADATAGPGAGSPQPAAEAAPEATANAPAATGDAAAGAAAASGATAGGQTASGATAGGQTASGAATGGGVAAPAAPQFITEQQAKEIALAQVPGATSIRLEFERYKNHAKYEGEMIHGWLEYEFEIDAITGAILKWKVDDLD
jgi:uncharacterized membrane protein YkoI